MTSAAAPGRSVTARVPAKVNLELLGRAPPATTATTTCPPSSRPSASTTTSPSSPPTTGASRSPARTPTWCRSTGPTSRLRAARALADAAGVAEPVHITIHKDIPVAGGHGRRLGRRGGRAGGLRRAVGPGLAAQRPGRPGRRPRRGRPVRLHGGTAIGSGRGDELAPVARPRRATTGSSPSATSAVHAGDLRRVRPAPRAGAGARAPAVRADDDGAALRRRRRARPGADQRPPGGRADLQPSLAEVLATGMECGALGGVVSGSGPTSRSSPRPRPRSTCAARCRAGSPARRARRRSRRPRPGRRRATLSGPTATWPTSSPSSGVPRPRHRPVLDRRLARRRRRRAHRRRRPQRRRQVHPAAGADRPAGARRAAA